MIKKLALLQIKALNLDTTFNLKLLFIIENGAVFNAFCGAVFNDDIHPKIKCNNLPLNKLKRKPL